MTSRSASLLGFEILAFAFTSLRNTRWILGHVISHARHGPERAGSIAGLPLRPSLTRQARSSLKDCRGLDAACSGVCFDFRNELFHGANVGFYSYSVNGFLSDCYALGLIGK